MSTEDLNSPFQGEFNTSLPDPLFGGQPRSGELRVEFADRRFVILPPDSFLLLKDLTAPRRVSDLRVGVDSARIPLLLSTSYQIIPPPDYHTSTFLLVQDVRLALPGEVSSIPVLPYPEYPTGSPVIDDSSISVIV